MLQLGKGVGYIASIHAQCYTLLCIEKNLFRFLWMERFYDGVWDSIPGKNELLQHIKKYIGGAGCSSPSFYRERLDFSLFRQLCLG